MAKKYDAEFVRELSPEFDRFMARADEVRWSPDDIAFDRIDHSKLTLQDLFSVYVTLHIENYSDVYRELLVNAYSDVPLVRRFVLNWEREEENHARTLEKYLTSLGYSIAELQNSYGLVQKKDFPVPTRDQAGLNIFVFLQELLTRESYKKILKATQEPVLTQIMKRVIRDEERHYRFYKQALELRMRLDRRDTLKQARHVLRTFQMPQTMHRQNAMTDQLVSYYRYTPREILDIAKPIAQIFPKRYLFLSPYAWTHFKHTVAQKLGLVPTKNDDRKYVDSVLEKLQGLMRAA